MDRQDKLSIIFTPFFQFSQNLNNKKSPASYYKGATTSFQLRALFTLLNPAEPVRI